MIVRPSVVIRENEQVLLMKYNYGGHFVYGLPGGNPDDGETLTATLVRELKEELGINIRVDQLLLAGEVLFPERKKSALHCVFSGQILEGVPKVNANHTTSLGCEWKELNSLGSLNLYPNVGKYLAKFTLDNSPPGTLYVGRIAQKWFE